MFTFKSVLKFFLILVLPFSTYPQKVGNPVSQWSYYDALYWGERYPGCFGYRQSPIHLRTFETTKARLSSLQLANYNVPLSGSVILKNKGQTVEFDVTPTVNGIRPLISGGLLNGVYEAVGVHFHWGSHGYKGSEHVIDNYRYDGEIHLVHKNVKYRTTREAMQYADGLAALAVMMEISNVSHGNLVLQEVVNALPYITNHRSNVPLKKPITLSGLLDNLDTSSYFTYKGSMTTPNCSEALTWHVFPHPILVSFEQMKKFWSLRDTQGLPLLNNYRPLQHRNERPVFYSIYH